MNSFCSYSIKVSTNDPMTIDCNMFLNLISDAFQYYEIYHSLIALDFFKELIFLTFLIMDWIIYLMGFRLPYVNMN